ncbi:MAG: carboxypeptidase-like regulatory domain-containing protein [Pyrinomonadaceae bacterium]
MSKKSIIVFSLALFLCPKLLAQSVINVSRIGATDALPASVQKRGETRTLSGVIISQQNELVPAVTVIARYSSGEQRVTSDEEGNFRLVVPNEQVTLTFEGKNVSSSERIINPGDATENLRIKIDLVASQINESVVIVGTALEPSIERVDGDGFDDDDPTDRPGLMGDEIQQHDSRLQQGVHVQYLRPFKLFGRQALLNAGSNSISISTTSSTNAISRRRTSMSRGQDWATRSSPGSTAHPAIRLG